MASQLFRRRNCPLIYQVCACYEQTDTHSSGHYFVEKTIFCSDVSCILLLYTIHVVSGSLLLPVRVRVRVSVRCACVHVYVRISVRALTKLFQPHQTKQNKKQLLRLPRGRDADRFHGGGGLHREQRRSVPAGLAPLPRPFRAHQQRGTTAAVVLIVLSYPLV